MSEVFRFISLGWKTLFAGYEAAEERLKQQRPIVSGIMKRYLGLLGGLALATLVLSLLATFTRDESLALITRVASIGALFLLLLAVIPLRLLVSIIPNVAREKISAYAGAARTLFSLGVVGAVFIYTIPFELRPKTRVTISLVTLALCIGGTATRLPMKFARVVFVILSLGACALSIWGMDLAIPQPIHVDCRLLRDGKLILFNPDGSPRAWYARRADGSVELFDHPGHHPTRSQTLSPVDASVVAQLERECSIVRHIELDCEDVVARRIAFFSAAGEPLYYYMRGAKGELQFFSGPGHDPLTNATLSPVTEEIIAELLQQCGARTPTLIPIDGKTLENGSMKFFGAQGEPLVWYSRGSQGSLRLFDGAGFDPLTNEPLRSVTNGVIAELFASFRLPPPTTVGQRNWPHGNARPGGTSGAPAPQDPKANEQPEEVLNDIRDAVEQGDWLRARDRVDVFRALWPEKSLPVAILSGIARSLAGSASAADAIKIPGRAERLIKEAALYDTTIAASAKTRVASAIFDSALSAGSKGEWARGNELIGRALKMGPGSSDGFSERLARSLLSFARMGQATAATALSRLLVGRFPKAVPSTVEHLLKEGGSNSARSSLPEVLVPMSTAVELDRSSSGQAADILEEWSRARKLGMDELIKVCSVLASWSVERQAPVRKRIEIEIAHLSEAGLIHLRQNWSALETVEAKESISASQVANAVLAGLYARLHSGRATLQTDGQILKQCMALVASRGERCGNSQLPRVTSNILQHASVLQTREFLVLYNRAVGDTAPLGPVMRDRLVTALRRRDFSAAASTAETILLHVPSEAASAREAVEGSLLAAVLSLSSVTEAELETLASLTEKLEASGSTTRALLLARAVLDFYGEKRQRGAQALESIGKDDSAVGLVARQLLAPPTSGSIDLSDFEPLPMRRIGGRYRAVAEFRLLELRYEKGTLIIVATIRNGQTRASGSLDLPYLVDDLGRRAASKGPWMGDGLTTKTDYRTGRAIGSRVSLPPGTATRITGTFEIPPSDASSVKLILDADTTYPREIQIVSRPFKRAGK